MRRRSVLALAGGAVLAGCAPARQLAGAPAPSFAGPRLETDSFVSFDGARLGMTEWPASTPEPSEVIVALHGVNDHSGGWVLPATAWAERGIATYAYDGRGFGRSPRRGVWADAEVSAEDLRTFVALVRARHPGAILAVLGESMGGALALHAFGSDRPPDADRLIATAPAVWGWRSQPWLYRTTLWTAAHLAGGYVLTPPSWVTRNRLATDNLEELRRMRADRQMLFRTRIDAIHGLVDLMQKGADAMPRVRTPLLVLYGGRDDMVPKEAMFAAVRRLPRHARSAYYPEGRHLLLRDLDRARRMADVEAFLRSAEAEFPSGAAPIPRASGARRRQENIVESSPSPGL